MFRRGFLLLTVALILLLAGCAGSAATVEAPLGQEFSLAIGQSAVITGEDLEIKFLEVAADSRCAEVGGVWCIWEGNVTCVLRITYNDSSEKVTLGQPGQTNQAEGTYKDYRFIYNVEPYPMADEEISPDEYRLTLTVNRLGD